MTYLCTCGVYVLCRHGQDVSRPDGACSERWSSHRRPKPTALPGDFLLDCEWQPTDRALPQRIRYSDRLFVADTTLPYRRLSVASVCTAYANLYDGNQVAFAAEGGTGRLASKKNGIQSRRAISYNTVIQFSSRFWNKTGATKQTIQDYEESVPSPAH